jgi:hypothetical protein
VCYIENAPVLDDMRNRVQLLEDAWVKEKSERSVPEACRRKMDELVRDYQQHVRLESRLLELMRSMNSQETMAKFLPEAQSLASEEENAGERSPSI